MDKMTPFILNWFLTVLCIFHIGFLKGQSYTDADRIRMRKEAEDLINLYEFGLNQLGSANERDRRWREDDINNILTNYFEGSSVTIFDDLSRENADSSSYSAREYLEKVGELYSKGVVFDYNLIFKNPCFQKIGDQNFYFVKAVVAKKLEGILFTDDAVNINTDSLDIFVKFNILQNRPSLVTGPAKIYSIRAHKNTECIDTLSLRRVSIDLFENNILRERAENFVKDYAITLNIIGNPKINERFNTTDYFESKDVKVYNDLIPIILLEEFTADDYLNNIELWYQEGIVFNYQSVRATNVLAEEDYVSVEVEVDRIIRVPERGYRNRQGISIFVKFPIDTDGRVGAERITPRIYRVEKKDKKLKPKNYLAVGGQINMMNYFGDLNPINRAFSSKASFTRLGMGVHAIKKLTPNLFVRLALSRGRVFGDDFTAADPSDNLARYRYIRNQHFRNTITELSLVGMYDLLPNNGLYYKRRLVSPYAFAGIAVFHHEPEAKTPVDLGATWINLKPLATEGQGKPGYPNPYSNFQVAIPFGLGVRFKLNYRLDLSLEFGLRYLFFDYLDDVSGNYPDPDDLDSPIARLMSNRTLESFSAFNGQSRQEDLERLLGEFNGLLTFQGAQGNFYDTFNGYGRRGDQRGGATVNDMYLLTGFHLSYLIQVGKTKTIRERPRYRIDFN